MARFTGKSVIVTGGASGIGRAAALAFAAEGGCVMVADQNGPGAEVVAGSIRAAGGTAAACRADISLFADCQALVDRTVEAFGGLHVAFNNAGIPGSMTKAVHEYDLEEWNRMITVNLTGVFHSLKA
jgi:NAD(P)-dependent dehydrogenase (short-subunit alcohol dehydrogenase family)